MAKTVLILNGPNLNLLGMREPEKYGSHSLSDLELALEKRAGELGVRIECRQSNHEGELVEWIQSARTGFDAIVINAGAYSHTSIAIRDALAAIDKPFYEVHITNIHAREPFRHHSHLSAIAEAVICGLGTRGYLAALEAIADQPAKASSVT